MKTIKILGLSVLLLSASVSGAFEGAGSILKFQNDKPAKTIVIKAGGAEDPAKFFSATRVVSFEVYKAGSSDEVAKIVTKIKASSLVENVITGKTTGDYSSFNVSLKEVKDKAAWIDLFKSAGLNHIKINNQPVTEISKL